MWLAALFLKAALVELRSEVRGLSAMSALEGNLHTTLGWGGQHSHAAAVLSRSIQAEDEGIAAAAATGHGVLGGGRGLLNRFRNSDHDLFRIHNAKPVISRSPTRLLLLIINCALAKRSL